MRSLAVVAVAAVVASVLAASPVAHGCSCATDEPAAILADAGTVVVGVVEQVDVRSMEHAVTTLRIERVVNGTVGGNDTIDVHSHAQGSACGLEVSPGQRTALVLERSGRGWESSLCQRLAPGAVLAAAEIAAATPVRRDDGGSSWRLPAALATLALAVGVAAAVVWRRRDRGDAPPPAAGS
jgi:hypothetical protein